VLFQIVERYLSASIEVWDLLAKRIAYSTLNILPASPIPGSLAIHAARPDLLVSFVACGHRLVYGRVCGSDLQRAAESATTGFAQDDMNV
jgi:hypothetical protein